MNKKENLLIVFVKNILLGKVKTRLAKSVGDLNAFEVYKHLVQITEKETEKLHDCEVHIYFSDVIIEEKWAGKEKFVQVGSNLGAKMQQAFEHGFSLGYTNIIGVGSDLPDLNATIISQGFKALKEKEIVFGPAEDGGYYLLGMQKIHPEIFENKPWSQENLLEQTLRELKANSLDFSLLETLNDVDTLEDLQKSSIAAKFEKILEKHLTS